MPEVLLESADAKNNFSDLSGVDSTAFANPYDALIEASGDDPKEIQCSHLHQEALIDVSQQALQTLYSTHRTTRNAQQTAKILSPDFPGVIIDQILQRLEDPSISPGYEDPRHCLVFWVRPSAHIKTLVSSLQTKLLELSPHIWLMPLPNLHMTALEIAHSLTSPEISHITPLLQPAIRPIITFPKSLGHRARLIKPFLSFDAAGVALSFLPAAGEASPAGRERVEDKFTYHHLRRDVFALVAKTPVLIKSRYVVPSAHITLGRFITDIDHDTAKKREEWIGGLERINAWLVAEFWPRETGDGKDGKGDGKACSWIVGKDTGLLLRKGQLWYGGGETVASGEDFDSV